MAIRKVKVIDYVFYKVHVHTIKLIISQIDTAIKSLPMYMLLYNGLSCLV